MASAPGRSGRRLIGAIASVLIGLATLVFAAVALFDLTHYSGYTMPASSMSPTIQPGTHVWARPVADAKVKTGEIVTFRTPSSNPAEVPGGLLVVARIVAVAGQEITTHDGRLVVNGRASGRVLVLPGTAAKLTVPVGAVYVLGDNRSVSGASNAYGPVSVRSIEQRVVQIGVPTNATLILRAVGGLLVAVLAAVFCWGLLRGRPEPVATYEHGPPPCEPPLD